MIDPEPHQVAQHVQFVHRVVARALRGELVVPQKPVGVKEVSRPFVVDVVDDELAVYLDQYRLDGGGDLVVPLCDRVEAEVVDVLPHSLGVQGVL